MSSFSSHPLSLFPYTSPSSRVHFAHNALTITRYHHSRYRPGSRCCSDCASNNLVTAAPRPFADTATVCSRHLEASGSSATPSSSTARSVSRPAAMAPLRSAALSSSPTARTLPARRSAGLTSLSALAASAGPQSLATALSLLPPAMKLTATRAGTLSHFILCHATFIG